MMIAVKIYVLAVYLLYLLEIVEAQKPCKVPQGGAGTCVHISKCPPLNNLYEKKYKTPHDNSYFQQSYCGRPGVAILKVCCPSESLWNKFEVKPVLYPHSTIINQTPTSTLTHSPTPTPTATERPVPTLDPDDIWNRGETFGNRYLQDECGIDTSSANKIIGGTKVVNLDQYPWLALLQYYGNVLACGGSLISHQFVLTAAHCLNGRSYGAPTHVRLSEYNTSSFPTDYIDVDGGGQDEITVQIIEVKTTFVHPSFDRIQKINDIGLAELARSVTYNDFIKAICLPDKNFVPDFSSSTNFTIAGWGSTGVNTESEVKLELSIPYVPWDRCEKVQDQDLMDTQICAGGVKGQDSCDGDSGGPLMYVHNEIYYAVGLISYGYRTCGKEGRPATHTNIFKYMSWIKKNING